MAVFENDAAVAILTTPVSASCEHPALWLNSIATAITNRPRAKLSYVASVIDSFFPNLTKTLSDFKAHCQESRDYSIREGANGVNCWLNATRVAHLPVAVELRLDSR
jgi:hypothetical protein